MRSKALECTGISGWCSDMDNHGMAQTGRLKPLQQGGLPLDQRQALGDALRISRRQGDTHIEMEPQAQAGLANEMRKLIELGPALGKLNQRRCRIRRQQIGRNTIKAYADLVKIDQAIT